MTTTRLAVMAAATAVALCLIVIRVWLPDTPPDSQDWMAVIVILCAGVILGAGCIPGGRR